MLLLDDIFNESYYLETNEEGNDELFAGVGDRLLGGDGDDILDATTGSGDNRLDGQDGNDTFFLGSGDRLLGGDGDDAFFATDGGDNILTGGAGADAFWIANGEFLTAANTITDFEIDKDVIGVSGLGVNTVDELVLTQQDDNTLISVSGFDLALVFNTTVADLQDNGSFVFGSPEEIQDTLPASEETSQIQAVQNLFDAIATGDKKSFLAEQTSDVEWQVYGAGLFHSREKRDRLKLNRGKTIYLLF